jgi:16S rRNA (guanine(966)-N(2))-methyltransferase RsmD
VRVISGSARGRKLFSPKDQRVRPTADRIKEALFSILTSRLDTWSGVRVLDLFAGTGSLGIEALSRGADHVVFCDSHAESIRLVTDNLQHCAFAAQATVIQNDALRALGQLQRRGEQFDLIFLDPPYQDKDLLAAVLAALANGALLSATGVVVVETDGKTQLSSQHEQLMQIDQRSYGDTALILLTRDL